MASGHGEDSGFPVNSSGYCYGLPGVNCRAQCEAPSERKLDAWVDKEFDIETNVASYCTENVVTLKVVTPDGKLVRARRRVRKSSTGYEMFLFLFLFFLIPQEGNVDQKKLGIRIV